MSRDYYSYVGNCEFSKRKIEIPRQILARTKGKKGLGNILGVVDFLVPLHLQLINIRNQEEKAARLDFCWNVLHRSFKVRQIVSLKALSMSGQANSFYCRGFG